MSSVLRPFPATPRFGISRRHIIVGFGIAAFAAISLLSAHFLTSGTKVGVVFAAILATAPIWVYLSIRRPFIFPFALYALLVPFSNLIAIGSVGTLTKLVGALSVGALLFYIIRTKQIVRPPTAVYAWLAFLAFALASILWAMDPQRSLSLIPILLDNFFLFAIVAITPVTSSDLRIVLSAIVIGGLCAAAYGAYQLTHGASVYQNRISLQSFMNETDTLDPDAFGTMLLLSASLALTAILSARSIWLKLLYLCGFAILMMGIYGSATRGAFLAMIAIIIYLVWQSKHRVQMLVVTAVAGLASLLLPTYLWTRIIHDNTGSGRLYIWKIGLDAFSHRWAFGSGIANFPVAYNQFFLRVYEPYSTVWNRAPHNFILMFAVELGVVGLALLAWALIAQYKSVADIQPTHPLYNLRVGLQAGFIGLLVGSMFFDVIYWKWAWLTFIALVMVRNASLSAPEYLAKPLPRRLFGIRSA